jgi:hypothetical protein
MTLDQLMTRDRRIDELERLGRDRTREQDHELGSLTSARDHHWRRLPHAIAKARRRAIDLEHYARQHRLPLEGAA